MGVVGLAEYVCTHPILNFYRGRSKLRSRGCRAGYRPTPSLACGLGHPQEFRMAQDSDDPLYVVNIVVCVLVIILAIVALHYPLPRRVVR